MSEPTPQPNSRSREVVVPSPSELGPAMKALTPRRQKFVLAYMGVGMMKGCATSAARAAGFKDGPGLKTTACRLLREKCVREAIIEELAQMDAQLGWRARARQAELMESEDEDIAYKASKTLLEMTGAMIKRTEMRVTHDLENVPTAELIIRIARVDPRRLDDVEWRILKDADFVAYNEALAKARAMLPPPIEGECVNVDGEAS